MMIQHNHESMQPLSIPNNLQAGASNPTSWSRSEAADHSAYNGETVDCSHAVLKYIHDMLMEEDDLDDRPCMLQQCLALQAAEKSLYEVIGKEYPLDQNVESPDENFTPTRSIDSSNSSISANISSDANRIFDQGKESNLPELEKNSVADRARKDGGYYVSNRTNGSRNYHHYSNGYSEGERSKKLPVLSETEHLEQLDDAFLSSIENGGQTPCPLYDFSRSEASMKQKNEQLLASDMRMRTLASKRETELWTLLTNCAQAAGSGDQNKAKEYLKQIRQQSSPIGDANQRLAHYFAIGLEARLAGTGMLGTIAPSLATAADILKAYELYVSICPFRKMTNLCANRTIARVADKATSVHIIDFGIGYGFQWPCFLYRQSMRPGGPPKIRITGIEFPQPGFRPAERVEETGRRLKRVADRLNVPFEYNAIAQKWENIRYEDLNINRDEVIVVNSMYRLKNLPDDTMVHDSPRDAVLKLIKRINPDIFIHGVSNGSYNAPFFATRFREALFHYSALFDMLEATTPREDQERLLYESEQIGKEVMNVIACEGVQRVQRPETHKQWQTRNLRMGFRQVPIHHSIIKKAKGLESEYHKDFIFDEDGDWILLGWKGKIIHAISAWKLVQE